ncbi:MAG: hypothetical protein JWM82_682 [Myxococcales bacterium]|nr:hypothetical protein [Myxococcales bacterium]
MRMRAWRLAAIAAAGVGIVVVAIRPRTTEGMNVVSAARAEPWTTLEPGAEHATTSEGGLSLELYRFDLRRFRPAVVMASGRDRRQRASDVLHDDVAAVAVVNGGFFDDHGRSLGLRISAGRVVVPLRPRVDWGVLFFTPSRARIVHSSEFVASAGIEGAVQVGPRIVVDGVVPGLKPQVARRTAVALDAGGTTLTLAVADEPVDATVLGRRLAAMGFSSALLLDGGPSTQLAVKPLGPSPRQIAGAYGVPDLLALFRRR